MFRYTGFDGLRGWLSWSVVACHIAFFTGLIQRHPQLYKLQQLGDEAVAVFIMLSGFVITHLIIEKQEPYPQYLWRRLLRIFPIYAVALLLAVATTYLNFDTFLASPPASQYPMPEIARLTAQRHALEGSGFVVNLLLHLTMLHGAVSSALVFESQYAFLRPAWSLSLEWQFYLLAPLIVGAARRRLPSIALALVAAVLYRLYLRGDLGAFVLPSVLPGAMVLFAIGIVSCLLRHRSQSHGSWLAIVIVIAAALRWPPPTHWAIVAWALFFGATLLKDRPGPIGRGIAAVYQPIFASRLARHFGLPSFSTYLLHLPILQLMQYLAVRQLQLDAVWANVLAIVGTLVGTYVASQAAFRWIEVPFIELGRGKGPLARSPQAAAPRERELAGPEAARD